MMKLVDSKIVTLDDVDLPETVYKYRTWNNDFHKRLISHQEVFFAAPSSFKDPLDCKFPIRWDLLTDQQIFNKYLTNSMEDHPERTEQEHIDFAKYWFANSPIRDERQRTLLTTQVMKEWDERIGILSLTAEPHLEEMWVKYAENHQGFCVGFYPKILFNFLGGGGEVTYVKKIPIILPTPGHSFEEQRFYQVFNKMEEWRFEKEYRTTIFRREGLTTQNRTRVIPTEAFTEIILGKNISDKHKDEIELQVSSKMNHVTLIEL